MTPLPERVVVKVVRLGASLSLLLSTVVGRAGGMGVALLLCVVEVLDDVVDEESGGQVWLPQARSVEQHPPPREAGQDRNPDEHPLADDDPPVTVAIGSVVVVTVVPTVIPVGLVSYDIYWIPE